MIRVWKTKNSESPRDGSMDTFVGEEVTVSSYFLGSKTVTVSGGDQKTADLELSALGSEVSENEVLRVELNGKEARNYKVIMREQSMLGVARVLLERYV